MIYCVSLLGDEALQKQVIKRGKDLLIKEVMRARFLTTTNEYFVRKFLRDMCPDVEVLLNLKKYLLSFRFTRTSHQYWLYNVSIILI